MPRETSSFLSRDLWREVGTCGSDRGTRPTAEWPPHDNGRCEDKGKIVEFGTPLMDGGAVYPQGIWSPSRSPKSSSSKHSKTMDQSSILVSYGFLSQFISLLFLYKALSSPTSK